MYLLRKIDKIKGIRFELYLTFNINEKFDNFTNY
jgi:hypothetical protein